jgi:hypothetical protein
MPDYRCEQCDIKFVTSLALQAHMSAMHGQQPTGDAAPGFAGIAPVTFHCAFCRKSYAARTELQDHLKKQHRDEQVRRAAEFEERRKAMPAGSRGRRRRRGGIAAA